MTIVQLSVAQPAFKEDLIALVEELRAGVEAGEIVSLVALPIFANQRWTTRAAGNMSMLELAGLLSRAWLDAAEELKG